GSTWRFLDRGNHLEFYIDEKLVLSYETGYNKPSDQNYIGALTSSSITGCIFQISNVEVEDLDAPNGYISLASSNPIFVEPDIIAAYPLSEKSGNRSDIVNNNTITGFFNVTVPVNLVSK